MEVILREHVDNLGRRGEVVKVADGYARNYLLPRKLALLATEGNKQQIERERAKFDAVEAEEQKVASAVAEPYSASVSPTFRTMTISTPAIRAAIASAACFSSASRASSFARSRSTCFLLPGVAASASLRGSR